MRKSLFFHYIPKISPCNLRFNLKIKLIILMKQYTKYMLKWLKGIKFCNFFILLKELIIKRVHSLLEVKFLCQNALR